MEVNESDIKTFFPFAVKTSPTTWTVNKHQPRDKNCRCTLELLETETEEKEEPLLPQYAYFKQDAEGNLVVNEHLNEGSVSHSLMRPIPNVIVNEPELPIKPQQPTAPETPGVESRKQRIELPEEPQPEISASIQPLTSTIIEQFREQAKFNNEPEKPSLSNPLIDFAYFGASPEQLAQQPLTPELEAYVERSSEKYKQIVEPLTDVASLRQQVRSQREPSAMSRRSQKAIQTLNAETAVSGQNLIQQIPSQPLKSAPTEPLEPTGQQPTFAYFNKETEQSTEPPAQGQTLTPITPTNETVSESEKPLLEQKPPAYTNFAYFGATDEQLSTPTRVNPQVRAMMKLIKLQRKAAADQTEENNFAESHTATTPKLRKTGIVRLMRGLRSSRSLELQGSRTGLQALGVSGPEAMIVTSVLIPMITMIVKEQIDLQLQAHNSAMEKQRNDEFRQAYRSVNPA